MKYEIAETINDQTILASFEGKKYIIKEIPVSDTDMYKKLIDLDCDNVVAFYETFTDGEGFYVAEEYVEGITLREKIEADGFLDDEQTRHIALQVCNGLKAVHKLGIIHRDINPNNIMITENGTVKIIDFGISRTFKTNKNHDTEILGTQGFTAPEQFGFTQTTEKSDIYSVGVLINCLKTGELPNDKLTEGYFRSIVLKCTQIDENFRYDDMDDLMKAIKTKHGINNIIKKIPGFRKGVWWHYLISIPYYLVTIIFLISSFFTSDNVFGALFTFAVFFFGLALPVFILMDFLNWTGRISFVKNKTKAEKITFQFIICIVSIIISCAFILADYYV